jgi:hypothetical protein
MGLEVEFLCRCVSLAAGIITTSLDVGPKHTIENTTTT